MRRPLARCLAVGLLLAGASCDLGPEGPGEFSGMVAGPDRVGAVVLEVTGAGIEGFAGQGDTQAIGARVSSAEGRHRVVLVSSTGELLRFRIQVSDLSVNKPVAEVLSAASMDDLTMSPAGIKVRIAR
ncbi:MAG: hypothetical protein P8170_19400 [Gemmatimonadota bacterium]|jgi:hypothetical protein